MFAPGALLRCEMSVLRTSVGWTIYAVALSLAAVGCERGQAPNVQGLAVATAGEDFAAERARMVVEQIAARGVSDPRVLTALRAVPRHELIPASLRPLAYADRPLPIEHRQTISQPYIVALMTELARVEAASKVLEIGTGSGYQAAVLAEVAAEVYSIEIIAELAASARANLDRLGYERVRIRHGDGYRGWPEEAPFDAILVTAAPPEVPAPLLQQLAIGGRLVLPVGERRQELHVIERSSSGYRETSVLPVRFVPMTGEVENQNDR